MRTDGQTDGHAKDSKDVKLTILNNVAPSLRMDGATSYTGCHRRNGPNFGRVFLMLNYTDTTQNTYIQS